MKKGKATYYVRVRLLFGNPYIPLKDMLGHTENLPKIGEGFRMVMDKPTVDASYLHTSTVQGIKDLEENGVMIGKMFATRNSTYLLNILRVEIDDGGPCTIPPAGWWCSRGSGHEGPCAAHPSDPADPL